VVQEQASGVVDLQLDGIDEGAPAVNEHTLTGTQAADLTFSVLDLGVEGICALEWEPHFVDFTGSGAGVEGHEFADDSVGWHRF
jgi:hypothetical protein